MYISAISWRNILRTKTSMIYTKELFSFILARDDFGSEEEEIIVEPKGKKIFFCAYARYLMFGVK